MTLSNISIQTSQSCSQLLRKRSLYPIKLNARSLPHTSQEHLSGTWLTWKASERCVAASSQGSFQAGFSSRQRPDCLTAEQWLKKWQQSFPGTRSTGSIPPLQPEKKPLHQLGRTWGYTHDTPQNRPGMPEATPASQKWGATTPPHVAGKGSPPQWGWGPALPRTAPLPSMSISSEETANWIRGSETKPAGNRHFCSLPCAEALSLCWLMSPCWLPSGRHTGALYVQPETAVIQHKSILGRVWGKNEMLASLQKREIISLGMTEL